MDRWQFTLRQIFAAMFWVAVAACLMTSVKFPITNDAAFLFQVTILTAWIGAGLGAVWRRIIVGSAVGGISGFLFALLAIQ